MLLPSLALALLGPAEPPLQTRTEQGERGLPRMHLGVQAGRHVGLYLWGDWQFWQWTHGGLSVGALFATHFLFQRDPRDPQPEVPIRGTDANVNIAATFGHTFRFGRGRWHLSTLGYAGVSVRSQHTELEDEVHDFVRRKDVDRAFSDLGAMLSLGPRIAKRWGLSVDAVIPLYLAPQARGLPMQWTLTSPYVGLSAAFYF